MQVEEYTESKTKVNKTINKSKQAYHAISLVKKYFDANLFECQFITVCNMFILIKCIVCVEINQYQIESPLVLSFKLETTPWTGLPEVS